MDNTTYKILKLFYDNSYLSCDNITGISAYDIDTVQKSCLFLRQNGYIYTTDFTQTDNDTIFPDSFYFITVEGKGCYEQIKRDNLRFRIPVIISVIALIISIAALAKP